MIRMYALALCAALGWGGIADAASLKIATLAPEGSSWMREMRAAGEAVKTATAGRVELKFFPGGVMGNSDTVLRKIKLGQLNGGAFAASELTAVYPDVAVFGLPFIFENVEAVRKARTALDPVIKAGFEQNGMVAAGITGGGFIYLMSTKSIATQAEIRATKVWVPEGDTIGRIAFEEAGITPVSLALGDVYTSLQTGLVETVGNTTTGAVAFQWATKLKYMVDLPVSYTVGILTFDKKALDKLSAEDRAAVIASVEAAFARLETLNAADDLATRETLKNEGIAIVPPQPEAAQAWRDVGSRTMARMQDEGQLSAAILDALKQAGVAGGSR
ncbi:MAG: TRAP transporter substrate-binding protein DctP [Rhodanobacteraceae bacterium]|nr:TRAP transporter substrate-binding protein DctP [Rhodanobacteraceae bacterium]